MYVCPEWHGVLLRLKADVGRAAAEYRKQPGSATP